MRKNNKYYLFIFLFYLFLTRDWLEDYIPLVQYADEIIALLAIFIWFTETAKKNMKVSLTRRNNYSLFIGLFLILGILGGIIYNYQPILTCMLPGAFLSIKFWLAIYTGKYLLRGFRITDYASNIYFHVRLVVWIYTILIALDWLIGVFPVHIRYGFRSTTLFYTHPSFFAAECVFLLAVLAIIGDNLRKKWSLYVIWLCILMCSTLRSKAIASSLLFLLVIYFIKYRKRPITFRTLLLFVPVAIFIAWDQIEFYFFSSIQSDSARYQLLIKSFLVASDHFPFGAGFGSYASHFSSVCYSPLYAMYGLNTVNGLQKGFTSFMSDSFWPAIIGESGWIGLTFYVIAVLLLIREIQRLHSVSTGYYMAALFMIIYELIISFAEASFFHPVAIQYAVLLGYMFSSAEDNYTNRLIYQKE